MKLFTPLVLLFTFHLSAQSSCVEKTKEVYSNIIDAIGNKFPPPPTLNFSGSERSVAFLSGNNIVIENKIVEELCEQKNFEDKISYIIAHELAHHYLSHNWMSNTGLSYASSTGDFIDDQASTKEQRKLAEISADLYAGFFGQISGYNTLGYASETLNYVYESYNLKKSIPGYPSFDERLEIIKSKTKEADVLSVLFEAGNVFLQLKEYLLAEKCYLDIIKNNFNSREINNNLGLTYLLGAISLDDVFSKYNYPIHLDLETRAETNKTRSNLSVDFNTLIKQAERYFNIAIQLDPKYEKAKKNILVLEFVSLKKQGIENIIKLPKFANIDDVDKADLTVIEMLIDGAKDKKIKKAALKGSELTQSNLTENVQKEEKTNSTALKHLGIEESDFLFGFKNTERLRSPRGELVIKRSFSNEATVFNINNTFLIKTHKELSELNLNTTTTIKEHTYFIYK